MRNTAESILVALAQAGDQLAFAELVKRQQSQVRNLLRRLCNDPALADDLAQQVFLKAWQRLAQLQQTSALTSWLRTIATNTWLAYLRKRDLLSDAADPEDLVTAPIDPTVGVDLDKALAALAPVARTCLVLNYQAGMTHEEISDSTQTPLGTVKSHINRSAQKLRETLAAYQPSSRGDQALLKENDNE